MCLVKSSLPSALHTSFSGIQVCTCLFVYDWYNKGENEAFHQSFVGYCSLFRSCRLHESASEADNANVKPSRLAKARVLWRRRTLSSVSDKMTNNSRIVTKRLAVANCRNKLNYLLVKFFGLHLQNNGSVVLDLLSCYLHTHTHTGVLIWWSQGSDYSFEHYSTQYYNAITQIQNYTSRTCNNSDSFYCYNADVTNV